MSCVRNKYSSRKRFLIYANQLEITRRKRNSGGLPFISHYISCGTRNGCAVNGHPTFQYQFQNSKLVFIGLNTQRNALGASILAQCYQFEESECPDLDDPPLLQNFFAAIQEAIRRKYILAYHDRSDGGLLTTVCEMMFAGHVGINLTIDKLGEHPIPILFNEELGAVMQIAEEHINDFFFLFA